MSNANRLLLGYGLIVASLLLATTNRCDNQSDPGSSVHYLGGNSNQELAAGSVALGTYTTKATTAAQKSACRWRVYHAVNGRWKQTSPRKVGDWNRVGSVFHKGSVKLKGHVLFQPRGCARWEMRK